MNFAISQSCNPLVLLLNFQKFMSTETPLDLKKTVNLPKTNFAQKANLSQSEPARLQKWNDLDLYRLICQSRAGREKFILHDGPPYANADIHLGTAMNKILKDFIVKSRTMMGFDAPVRSGLRLPRTADRATRRTGTREEGQKEERPECRNFSPHLPRAR